MEYILAVLALVATVVGIFNNTSPTMISWVAGATAFLVCILTMWRHFNQQRKEKVIAAVAYLQVLRAVHGIVEPFAIMIASIDLGRKKSETDPKDINKRVFQFFNRPEEQLISRELLSIYTVLPLLLKYEVIVDSYKMNDRAVVLGPDGPEWKQLFQETAVFSLQKLDSTMNTYRSVMDSTSVEAIERLRGCWLIQCLHHLPGQNSEASLGRFLKLFEILPGASERIYEDFLRVIELAHRICRDRLESAKKS